MLSLWTTLPLMRTVVPMSASTIFSSHNGESLLPSRLLDFTRTCSPTLNTLFCRAAFSLFLSLSWAIAKMSVTRFLQYQNFVAGNWRTSWSCIIASVCKSIVSVSGNRWVFIVERQGCQGWSSSMSPHVCAEETICETRLVLFSHTGETLVFSEMPACRRGGSVRFWERPL